MTSQLASQKYEWAGLGWAGLVVNHQGKKQMLGRVKPQLE